MLFVVCLCLWLLFAGRSLLRDVSRLLFIVCWLSFVMCCMSFDCCSLCVDCCLLCVVCCLLDVCYVCWFALFVAYCFVADVC